MTSIRHNLCPSFKEEKKMMAEGYRFVAGVDEVGRGCLAGPVMASAVILPYPCRQSWLKEVRDSKMLTIQKREYLHCHIEEIAIAIGVGVISHEVIDDLGIAVATRLAMKQAVEKILPPVDSLLIDYFKLPEMVLPQKGVLHGDGLSYSIACASIIAKVVRDRFMLELDSKYPGYGFHRHKGYGTKDHFEAIQKLGLSPIHRHLFCHTSSLLVNNNGQ
jgi:ribonuclease HII